MGDWSKLELSAPDFDMQPFIEAIEAIKEFINAVATILDLILSIVQAIADPLVEAIKAVLEALKETVESFLEDAGIYMLYVPIKKRLQTNFIDLGDITPPIADKLGMFGQPNSGADPTNPNVTEFLVNSNRYSGGNPGFFSTVLESLYDKGDTSRPQFESSDDYIAYYTLLMGTNVDLLGFLDDLWKFRRMFNLPNWGATNTIPTPTGLNARAMGKPSGGNVDIFLQWDPVSVPITELTDLGGVVLYPKEYAIARVKDDVTVLGAKSPEEFFGTRQLIVGENPAGNGVVLDVKTFNALDTTYIDKDVPAEDGDTYYYVVAWKFAAYANTTDYANKAGETELDFWYMSNVSRVTPDPILPASTPPDWIRTPSVADLFPALAEFLRYMVAQIEILASKFTNALDILSDYVDFLKSEVQRYEEFINKILDLISRMTLSFDMPTAGIYMRSATGVGGNTFFVTDLANSLSRSFDTAPPFHEGDEYVTGLVLMAGGPQASTERFSDAMSLLFGTVNKETSALLDQIEQQVAAAEEVNFGDSMQIEEPEVVVESNDDFSSLEVCSKDTNSVTVTFTDDFSPIYS